MIVARQLPAGPAIFEREVHHPALAQLAGLFAEEFFPRGVVLGYRRLRPFGQAPRDLRLIDQRVAGPLVPRRLPQDKGAVP